MNSGQEKALKKPEHVPKHHVYLICGRSNVTGRPEERDRRECRAKDLELTAPDIDASSPSATA